MTPSEFKDHLIMMVDGTAEWRTQKAVEYPDDDRNQKCADVLRRVAKELEALSVDHPAFRALWEAWYAPEIAPVVEAADLTTITEAENEYISRYGFDGEDADTTKFLVGLRDVVLTAAQDAIGQ